MLIRGALFYLTVLLSCTALTAERYEISFLAWIHPSEYLQASDPLLPFIPPALHYRTHGEGLGVLYQTGDTVTLEKRLIQAGYAPFIAKAWRQDLSVPLGMLLYAPLPETWELLERTQLTIPSLPMRPTFFHFSSQGNLDMTVPWWCWLHVQSGKTLQITASLWTRSETGTIQHSLLPWTAIRPKQWYYFDLPQHGALVRIYPVVS